MTRNRPAWLAQVVEDALEPERAIIDPHHHLWREFDAYAYGLDDLRNDTTAGHRVLQTVYVECGAEWRTDGPVEMRPVGETEFAVAAAKASASAPGATIAGFTAFADLLSDDSGESVIAEHVAVGGGLVRSIRFGTAWHEHPKLAMGHTSPPAGAMEDPRFRRGVALVGRAGLAFEAMIYHPQIPELIEVARTQPEVTIVANHLCCPIGVGPYRGHRDEVMAEWRVSIAELATCPNVVMKIGGIGMPLFGLRWDFNARPPTSEELAAPWRDDIRWCIDQFGSNRCMFETNYPVDSQGASYNVLWNAFKRIVADASENDKSRLFHDTAARVYRLPPVG
ncbi:MAG: amidohydrolase [Ilumatobacteraceae bacterium]